MAGTQTTLADLIVPEIFTPYTQVLTEEKSRLIQSGAVQRDPSIDGLLAGGGLTFHIPSYLDLENVDERVSAEDAHMSYVTAGADDPDPENIEAVQEIAVRLNRNQSWSANDLSSDVAGTDPMAAIAGRVAYYWTRRLQKLFIAIMTGVFADNTANDAGDYTNDISGVGFVDGVTNFSAEAYIDARITMGDSQDALGLIFVHSTVYGRMQKNNLIEFIPDSEGRVVIPTFQGAIVVVDDGMPSPSAGVYESWLFGQGAVRYGVGQPKVATEVARHAGAGNGGGQETLYNRVVWCMHPVGHSYIGIPPNGGPTNANTLNNLADDASWNRVYPERKQIKIARLITREF